MEDRILVRAASLPIKGERSGGASTRLPSLRLALTASIVTRPRHLTSTQCAVADRSFAVRWTAHRIHIDCVQRGRVADSLSELFGSCGLGALQ